MRGEVLDEYGRPQGVVPAARHEGIVTEDLDDGLLLYDLERDKGHSLNAVAAAVWRHCDGERDAAEIAGAAGAQLAVNLSEDAVWRAVSQLDERRLLLAPSPRRMSGPEFSRRQALLKAAGAGAAAGLAIPVIKSIVAPTPAQAQASCVPLNGQCGLEIGEGICSTAGFGPCCSTGGALIACVAVGAMVGSPCRCQASAPVR